MENLPKLILHVFHILIVVLVATQLSTVFLIEVTEKEEWRWLVGTVAGPL